MKVLQIAGGIVLGLLCWHFLISLSEMHARRATDAEWERAYEQADIKCRKNDYEACKERMEIGKIRTERLVEDINRLSEN